MVKEKASDVLAKLEPGTPFRFQVSGIAGRQNWIYCQYRGLKGGKVQFSYWDHRYDWATDWERRCESAPVEVWDPTIPLEELERAVWLEYPDGEYSLLTWVLGELEGSEWVNWHTWDVRGEARVDWDRWGRIQLWHRVHDGIGKWHSLTKWRDVEKARNAERGTVGEDLTIEHWLRYDTMDRKERIAVARHRLRYCQELTRSDHHNGGAPPWADRQLEEAKRALQALTGEVLPLEVLNAGIRPGEQLALL